MDQALLSKANDAMLKMEPNNLKPYFSSIFDADIYSNDLLYLFE